jgi:aralkylamine N-acetyltransferase
MNFSTSEVTFRYDKNLDLESWLRFYYLCDWYRGGTIRHLEAVRGYAYLIVTAWIAEQMVGSLTVLSDGVNDAIIEDVVVHPEYRHQGIGSELVRQALSRLKHIPAGFIKLESVPGVDPFYEQLGFVRSSASLMYLREHEL